MSLSRETRAAIGDIAVQTTWLEYLMARLVANAEQTDNIPELLLEDSPRLVKRARQATARMDDPDVAQRTLAWLKEVKNLRKLRHEVIHSIVLYTHRPGWIAYHPRAREAREYSTREIVDLANRARDHADEGNYMSLFDWPKALGLVDPDEDMDEEDADE